MTTNQQTILNFFYNNLDTISRIHESHKLYINSDNSINIEEPYMFQGLWRYCYNISRKDAIYILTKLFNDIEIYFNAIYVKNIHNDGKMNNNNIIRLNELDYIAFTTIIDKLNKTVPGVENLKKTYSSDENTCNELDRIIKKIKLLISTFQTMI
jgi:hypothetical protein